VVRGGRSRTVRLEVASGTLVRAAVRAAGEAPEGSLVLCGETPLPLDTSITEDLRLLVVPTFSGG